MPDAPTTAANAHAFLDAASECGRLITAYDWSRTALGPLAAWPQGMKATVAMLVRSKVPMVAMWGADGLMTYNDAYAVIAGGRHPRLLGSRVREGWTEASDFNDHVMRVCLAGGTLAYRDQEFTLFRRGRPEQPHRGQGGVERFAAGGLRLGPDGGGQALQQRGRQQDGREPGQGRDVGGGQQLVDGGEDPLDECEEDRCERPQPPRRAKRRHPVPTPRPAKRSRPPHKRPNRNTRVWKSFLAVPSRGRPSAPRARHKRGRKKRLAEVRRPTERRHRAAQAAKSEDAQLQILPRFANPSSPSPSGTAQRAVRAS